MDNFFTGYPASGSTVSSVNGLDGAIVLAAGSNITITPAGNTLTIASTGGGGGIGVQDNNTFIQWRNFADDADYDVIGMDAADTITIGGASLPTGAAIYIDAQAGAGPRISIDSNSDLNGEVAINGTLLTLEADGVTPTAIQLFDGDDNESITLQTPQTLSTSSILILPDGEGSAGQVLTTDGNSPAQLSWETVSGGSLPIWYAHAVDDNGVNVANPATATFDGVVLTAGQILYELGNVDATNGLWVFNGIGIAMTRPSNWANASTIPANSWVIVSPGGTTYGGSLIGNPTAVVVGSDTPNSVFLPVSTASGSFTTVDLKTVTVMNGIITSIV